MADTAAKAAARAANIEEVRKTGQLFVPGSGRTFLGFLLGEGLTTPGAKGFTSMDPPHRRLWLHVAV